MTLRKKNLFGEFDITKAIAILFLPFVHFIEEAGYKLGFIAGNSDSIFGIITLLSIFGPSVFMICMGVRIQKNYNSKRMIHNGIQFLIIGYLLNFFICTLPTLLYACECGPVRNGTNLIYYAWRGLFGADIYIFVGWFFIFYGLLKKCFKNISTFYTISISAVMLLVNNFVGHTVELDYSIGSQIIGNFVTVNDESYFPLAGWAIFVFIGMALRDYLNANNYKLYQKQMTRVLVVGFGGTVMLGAALSVYDISIMDIFVNFASSYTIDIFTVCALILLSLTMIGIISKIYYAVKENPLERLLQRISMYIMSYYIIQWLLVALFVYYIFKLFINIPGFLPVEVAFAIMILIFIASVFLTSKFGYSFMKFLLRITDYSKWFKKKSTKS